MLLWLDDVYGYCLKQFITPNINTNKTVFLGTHQMPYKPTNQTHCQQKTTIVQYSGGFLAIFSSYKRIKEYTTLGFVFIQTLLYVV